MKRLSFQRIVLTWKYCKSNQISIDFILGTARNHRSKTQSVLSTSSLLEHHSWPTQYNVRAGFLPSWWCGWQVAQFLSITKDGHTMHLALGAVYKRISSLRLAWNTQWDIFPPKKGGRSGNYTTDQQTRKRSNSWQYLLNGSCFPST